MNILNPLQKCTLCGNWLVIYIAYKVEEEELFGKKLTGTGKYYHASCIWRDLEVRNNEQT